MVEVERFWQLLDIEPDMMELFTKLDPHWFDGMLLVHESYRDDPDLIDMIRTCFLYCFAWQRFNAARWMGG